MPLYLTTTIDETNVFKTVEKILKQKFKISSKLFIKLKLNGKIMLNGIVCRSIDKGEIGDTVSADIEERESSDIEAIDLPLDIIYEDDYIVIINKPSNMSVHPSIGNQRNTLANALMFYWKCNNEQHIFHAVNRLDKNTSGICVVAKNQYIHSILSEQIKNKTFFHKYKAILCGHLFHLSGIIEKPIKRENESIIKRIVSDEGKYALTKYKVLQYFGDYTLVDIKLETGRTHQIRVHFSSIGYPLLGDWLYGSGDEDKSIINRQALHAYYLEFIHPITEKIVKIESDLPKDMKKILKILE